MLLIADPTPSQFAALEAAQPGNPFATFGHSRALAGPGAVVGILQIHEEKPTTWAHAVIRRGRVTATLEVTSLPSGLSPDGCAEVRRLARRDGLTSVALETFGSPADAVVRCDGVRFQARREFVWWLPAEGELIASLSRTHRERARKAIKAGVEIRDLPPPNAMAAVHALHDLSLDRRAARGEQVARGHFEFGDRLVEYAGARVFGAIHEGTLIAAVLVAVAARGAYTVYSGNAPDGMKIGAAHWLRVEVAEQMRREGRDMLNLAGASADQEGLADFKRRFGTEERALANVHINTVWGWRKLVQHLRGID